MQKVSELRKDKTQQIIAQAERYIDENLGNPELTIQAISDHVDLSAPYFSNIFSRAKGIHLNEYINRARVREAQKRLLDSNDKILVIAQKLGFTSSSYFNSVFKRYTGMTPKQFRESGKPGAEK
jgi:two-component system response regulator YesN